MRAGVRLEWGIIGRRLLFVLIVAKEHGQDQVLKSELARALAEAPPRARGVLQPFHYG